MNKPIWLQELRKQHDMTHDQVAQAANIHRSYYTKIECGCVPSVRVAKKLANVLGFDWSKFYQ